MRFRSGSVGCRPLVLIGLLLLPCWAPVQGQDAEQLRRQLEQLRERIEQLKEERQEAERTHAQALDALRAIESTIGELGGRIRSGEAELRRLDAELDSLAARAARLEQELGSQRVALAGQLRSAYAFGLQPQLKLLLDLEDPASAGRILSYYRYYNRARLELLSTLGERLAELARLRRELETTRASRQHAMEALRSRREEREQARSQRRNVVDRLLREMSEQDAQLAVLGQDRQRIESLLAELRDLMTGIPPGGGTPFASLRGRLAWPVPGELVLPPGSDKPGGMQRDGALIGAETGADVRAVSYGRVAYADWLRGFGLLAIIDHGDGYLSLYGFNDTLLVEEGDWVEPGQVIAAVGRSGAQSRDALYFELRKDGSTIDPVAWFSSETP